MWLMSVQIWFELYRPPTKDDKDLLETVLESWFLIGRLGGFNGMNMQVRSPHRPSHNNPLLAEIF